MSLFSPAPEPREREGERGEREARERRMEEREGEEGENERVDVETGILRIGAARGLSL